MQDGVTVRDVMSREFVGVSEGDALEDVLEVMVAEAVPSVVVLRGSTPVGLVTNVDVLELVADDDTVTDRAVDDVMRPPPESIDPERDVSDAMDRLSSEWPNLIPVTNGEAQLVGVISEADVLAAAASLFAKLERPGAGTDPGRVEATPGEPTGGTMETPSRSADPYTNHAETTTGGAAETPANGPSSSVSTQGVCESCGSLVGELGDVNGQLICRECRDV